MDVINLGSETGAGSGLCASLAGRAGTHAVSQSVFARVKRLAIIGTGIAGLGCAHFLHRRYDLTIYEKNDYIGGHANTVSVPEGSRQVPIDTGFMVFNQVTYPNLTRLFRELDDRMGEAWALNQIWNSAAPV